MPSTGTLAVHIFVSEVSLTHGYSPAVQFLLVPEPGIALAGKPGRL